MVDVNQAEIKGKTEIKMIQNKNEKNKNAIHNLSLKTINDYKGSHHPINHKDKRI